MPEWVAIINAIFNSIPISGVTWIVLAIIAFVVFIVIKADDEGTLRWEDLIVDDELNKISPYKLGFLIGIIVSTWVVISLADRDMLSFDILALFLSYLLGGAGWSEFISRKHRLPHDEESNGSNESKRGRLK